jgi:hypothetical protein
MGTYTADTPKWDLTARADRGMRVIKHTITAGDISDSQIVVETNMVGADPVIFVRGYTSAGILKNGALDVITWDSATGNLKIELLNGVGDFEADDVLHIMLVETP